MPEHESTPDLRAYRDADEWLIESPDAVIARLDFYEGAERYARLFAAAPAMLELLRGCEKVKDGSGTGTVCGVCHCWSHPTWKVSHDKDCKLAALLSRIKGGGDHTA